MWNGTTGAQDTPGATPIGDAMKIVDIKCDAQPEDVLTVDPTDAELEEARALLDEDEVVYRGG